MQILSIGSGAVPCGQTDGREVNVRFSQLLCRRA